MPLHRQNDKNDKKCVEVEEKYNIEAITVDTLDKLLQSIISDNRKTKKGYKKENSNLKCNITIKTIK